MHCIYGIQLESLGARLQLLCPFLKVVADTCISITDLISVSFCYRVVVPGAGGALFFWKNLLVEKLNREILKILGPWTMDAACRFPGCCLQK